MGAVCGGLIAAPFLRASGAFRKELPHSVPNGIPLRWLDGVAPSQYIGSTFTTPWSEGEVRAGQAFGISDQYGNRVSVQSWPLAYWPDQSVKWYAHSVGRDLSKLKGGLHLVHQHATKEQADGIRVLDEADAVKVDAGTIQVRFNKSGRFLIEELKLGGKVLGKRAFLQIMKQDAADTDSNAQIRKITGYSTIEYVTVENQGAERVVVKVEGAHDFSGEKQFPFILRFYIYRNSPTIKLVHTFFFDGDEHKDFIRGIGLSFEVAFGDQPYYNRHVRFAGNGGGIFAESPQNLTGLRRDPGEEVRKAQTAGLAVHPEQISEQVRKGLPYIPVFAEYSLSQLSSRAFAIEKRTGEGHAWIHAAEGGQADGVGYVGSPDGGLAIGIRDFWKNYPAQIDVSKANGDIGLLTAWLWSPRAPAMDLRFYHDGMGQDTYEKQWEGLEITYEDYEEGFGTPHGVAKTSEGYLHLFDATPTNGRLADFAKQVRNPSLLLVRPETLSGKGVFGVNWGIPDRSNGRLAKLEEQLDRVFEFYRGEVDRRGWYGFWNYGDVMHSYDEDRHQWRYDVGGYAWDNSELSTDLWLWYYFLRSGNAAAFRFAEAMCRHTGEVDVHHLGKFAPLGSRHNVQHWGCSAKQLRISTAINRRFYYYLTADERTGDLLREQLEAVRRLKDVPPQRKRVNKPLTIDGDKVWVGFGTDWGAIAAAWFTEWERTLDRSILARLKKSMEGIAAQPRGFFSGASYFEINSGTFDRLEHDRISVSHLNAVFGLAEICQEIVQTIPDQQFEQAWLQYCMYYNAPPEERESVLGTREGRFGLKMAHSRLTAYAAARLEDPNLAQRAWSEFFSENGPLMEEIAALSKPDVLQDGLEWPGISTNWAAQWSLAAIQCLYFIGEKLDG